jgi:hypothetical protein
LQADAAEFVPGGMPLMPHAMQSQQQYSYPQMPYHYGTVPSNFMVNFPAHV